MSNQFLAPVHGLSLVDYSAIVGKIAAGTPEAEVLALFGIESPVWADICATWERRMAEDTSFQVVQIFSQAFAKYAEHPKFSGATTTPSNEHLARLNAEPMFYYELAAARDAAYEHGIDGAQWVANNFGINLADFQAAAVKHTSADPTNQHNLEHYAAMSEKYTQYFTEQQGGSIADDVNF